MLPTVRAYLEGSDGAREAPIRVFSATPSPDPSRTSGMHSIRLLRAGFWLRDACSVALAIDVLGMGGWFLMAYQR